MEPDRWARVQSLFEAALEHGAGDVEEWLEARCAGDPALLAEVASLLRAHARALGTTFIGRPAVMIGEQGVAEDAATPAGEPWLDLGRYRLVRRLGRGGMGSVYLGFRADDSYQQQVAVKLLRRDLDHGELIRRFARERQILAQLDHPNIARLLDGGTAPDGRPYLVMTYVEGMPIDSYCRAHGLGVEDRLRLFVKVCAAVHFAHQNLVVHRDIKPANVLVDAGGEPMLLDFGIAKLLDSERFPMTVAATAPGMRMLTPSYASPEQVRGMEVTTASDVYTLGVLLYELLAGERPYALDELPADEALRHVLEVTPFRPSTAVLRGARGRAPEAATPVPAASARRLARRLAGDLDTIALKALAKEPERRYASAEALARDVDRHLRGLPVAARGDSVAYRAGRFVRRNAVSVAISGMAVLGLLALSISLLVQRGRTVEQRDRAAAVSTFMVDIFNRADPGRARGETITAREVLDRGREQIDQLEGRPLLQADLLVTMGRVYRSIGLLAPAEEMLARALALRRARYPGDHAEVAECLELLGDVLHDRDDIEHAEPLLRQAVEMRRRLHGPSAGPLARAQVLLASALHRAGRFDEARTHYEQAVAASRALGRDDVLPAQTLNALGTLERDAGNLALAESLTRQALVRLEAAGDVEHSAEAAWVLTNLGSAVRDQGRYAEAEALLRRAETIARTVYDEPHPRLSHALNELGVVLDQAGRAEESETALRDALATRQAVYGADHVRVAETLNALAAVALGRGDYEQAAVLLERSLAIKRRTLPEDHPEVAATLGNLAHAMTERGAAGEAAALYEQAIAIYRRQSAGYGRELAVLHSNLARLASAEGDEARAISLRENAVTALAALLGVDHPEVAKLTYNLGTSYHRAGRLDEARAAYERALAVAAPALGDDHPLVAAIHTARAGLTVREEPR